MKVCRRLFWRFSEEVSVLKKYISAFTCASVLLLLLLVACGSPAQAVTSGNANSAQAGRTPATSLAPTATRTGRTPVATVAPALTSTAQGLPRPAHVVIVIEENHSFRNVIG